MIWFMQIFYKRLFQNAATGVPLPFHSQTLIYFHEKYPYFHGISTFNLILSSDYDCLSVLASQVYAQPYQNASL